MFSIKKHINKEIIINKSRFICSLYRLNTIDDVNIYLNEIKCNYKDATHHCYSYILGNIKRFNDDNEPSGTAGKPILEVLEKNNLNYILCIVTRYFGGIKLGAGGLVRAYSKSVSSCISKDNIIELVKGKKIQIIFEYDKQKEIDYLLKNITIDKKEFNDKVSYTLKIDDDLLDLLSENKIDIRIIDNVYIEKASAT